MVILIAISLHQSWSKKQYCIRSHRVRKSRQSRRSQRSKEKKRGLSRNHRLDHAAIYIVHSTRREFHRELPNTCETKGNNGHC